MKALIGACGLHIHCDATLFSVCMHVRVGLRSGGRVKQMCEHNLGGMEKKPNVYVCVFVSENISNCVLHRCATETHLIARHLKGRMIEPATYTSFYFFHLPAVCFTSFSSDATALRINPSLWRLVNRKGKRPWDILSNITTTFLFQCINFMWKNTRFLYFPKKMYVPTNKSICLRNHF